jgi:lipopolysaccharide biosynthesis glycosyltransferase
VENHPEYLQFWDQDAMNIVLAGQWKPLDLRWNRTVGIALRSSWQETTFDAPTFLQLKTRPFIVHFTTKFKPWNAYRHPDKHLFYKYLDLTAWAGWRLTFWQAVGQRVNRFLRGQS